jgi:hypothetical protein
MDVLPFEEREAFISTLYDDDRAAVWGWPGGRGRAIVPDDDGELGGGDRWPLDAQNPQAATPVVR